MAAPTIEWIRPGVGYTPLAAASMRRLEMALGRAHDCNSSYRDWAKQQSMHDAYQRYMKGLGPYPGHSYALPPEKSMHCRGLADDSDDWTTPGYIALAAEHGWIRTAAGDPTERHHFEYQVLRDRHFGKPTGGGGVVVTPTPVEPGTDVALLRRRKEQGMYVKGTSYADVYKVDSVWNDQYPKGQARMRVCGAAETAYAITGNLVVQGLDSYLQLLASDTAYGQPMPKAAQPGLEVIMIQDGGNVTYALTGNGYWDDTEGMPAAAESELANAWARLYGNAKNLTYAEWNDRKAASRARTT